MVGTEAINLTEAASQPFQGPKKRPPVKPPPEPGRKSPPIGPPKRDPKPEPIHDPPMPPSPGNDPNDEHLPIGDPPDTSDQPIRMTFRGDGYPKGLPMDDSLYRGGVASIKTPYPTIGDPFESRERRSR